MSRAETPSSLEWLDTLPSDWVEREIGREVWVRARLGWKGLTADEYVDDGIPMLATPDIKGRQIAYHAANQVTVQRFDESPEIQLRNGDVLLTKDGNTIGTVNVVRDLPGPATVNGSIAVLTPLQELDGRFLYWFIASSYAQSIFDRLRGGMGVPHLFQRDINRIRFPYPPLDEQRTIADYLDRETARIDTLIEEQQRLMEMLQDRRQALIEHATATGSATPPGRWRKATLRRIGRFVTGTTPTGEPENIFDPDGQLAWARPEDLGGRVSPSRRLSALGSAQVRPVRNAVLVCCIGATVGKVGWTDGQISSNQQITAIETDGSAKYWYYALKGSRSALVALAVGNTIPILNNMRLAELNVAVPPIAEQHEIAAYLDEQTASIDTLITETERFIELACERREALITAAVTGQIDVREAP